MQFINEPVFTETSDNRVDAVIYQAMFDETIRLRKCISKSERQKIREFLIEAHHAYNREQTFRMSLNTVQDSKMQQPQESNTQDVE